jgi:DNA-binding NarL/FixJ family response regulator
METIRVLLVDNEEVFRQGLAKLLNDQPHIEVIYQCGDASEALKKSKEARPDVILIDSKTPEPNVADAVREIMRSSPDAKVAVVSRSGAEPGLLDVMKAGARACLAKSISAADLIKSVELISSGRIIISPVFAEAFLREIVCATDVDDKGGSKSEAGLSEREIEIVKLVTQGATNKEIARALFIAENTVKVHVKNILSKLELRNRQQLVAYAVLRNWVIVDTIGED